MSWWAIAVLGAGAYAAKAAGVAVSGRVSDDGLAIGVIALLPPALLAALIVVQTFDGVRLLVLDARVAGVGVGALLAWRRAPLLVVMVVAAAVTAAIRAV